MQIDETASTVVTGAASGLGRATARLLVEAGIKVAVFDLNEESGQALADEIGGVFCKVDVMDEQSVIDGFAKARAAHGRERVLVHCAQVAPRGKTVGRNRETGELTRMSTEDHEFAARGVFVASYRVASTDWSCRWRAF